MITSPLRKWPYRKKHVWLLGAQVEWSGERLAFEVQDKAGNFMWSTGIGDGGKGRHRGSCHLQFPMLLSRRQWPLRIKRTPVRARVTPVLLWRK